MLGNETSNGGGPLWTPLIQPADSTRPFSLHKLGSCPPQPPISLREQLYTEHFLKFCNDLIFYCVFLFQLCSVFNQHHSKEWPCLTESWELCVCGLSDYLHWVVFQGNDSLMHTRPQTHRQTNALNFMFMFAISGLLNVFGDGAFVKTTPRKLENPLQTFSTLQYRWAPQERDTCGGWGGGTSDHKWAFAVLSFLAVDVKTGWGFTPEVHHSYTVYNSAFLRLWAMFNCYN